jgi:hypothetical protein
MRNPPAQSVFRIFSGFDPRQAEAAEVFAYSVRANASVPVDVGFVNIRELPVQRQGVTEFTYSRFLVPWLCRYVGRAVYADGCDQLCLGDVAELAAHDMEAKAMCVVKHPSNDGRRPRVWSSLMLLDCHKLSYWDPAFVEGMPDSWLMRFERWADDEIGSLPPEWNALVEPGSEPPEGAKLAHWTALSDPNGAGWIDRSGSKLWQEWRQRWVEANARRRQGNPNA